MAHQTSHSSRPPIIVVDADIPYIKGRLEPFAEVKYLSQEDFTHLNVKDADALIIRTRTRCNRFLLEGSNVKFIATATIGTDQISDEDCRNLGIQYTNSPGCNAPAVSQYVWSALLRLGFKKGMSLGIIGCGNVGKIVKEWGERLGYKVLVNDPPRALAEGEEGFTSLESLLSQSDAVTIHTPYTKDGPFPTHHLMGANEFNLLKPGAIYVNAARGPVNSSQALLNAIDKKYLRTAIDVWEGEPQINLELLSKADIATFHIAGYSIEGKQRATAMVSKAIGDFFGFFPDISDLPAPYSPPSDLSEEIITTSFDPFPLMFRLKDNPSDFDKIRADYELRHEIF